MKQLNDLLARIPEMQARAIFEAAVAVSYTHLTLPTT
jgi:hypothetical protein